MSAKDRRGAPRARVRWPVLLESFGGGLLVGEVVDLSTSGARLRAPGDLGAGSGVTLKVTLPRGAERLEVVGRVTRRQGDEVAVDFVGLPETEARRVRPLLETWESRRRSPRVPVALSVTIERTAGGGAPARLEDLSAFGARITCERRLDPGEMVRLHLSGAPGDGPMRLTAVVWGGGAAGTVLVFVNLTEAEFHRLAAYVDSLLGPGA